MSEQSIITKYDEKLSNFAAFKMRPFMLPHIGKDVDQKGILFIMESHYDFHNK